MRAIEATGRKSDFHNWSLFDLQLIAPADVGVEIGAGARGAFHRLAVDGDEAETEPVAFVPFEIVEERPVEIAADIDIMRECFAYGVDGFSYPFFAQGVPRIGEPVFGDIDRFFVLFQIKECLIEGFGMEFPAEVGDAFFWIFSEAVVDDISIVEIETDEVLRIFYFIEEPFIPKEVRDFFEESIDGGITRHFEDDLMFGDADLAIRIVFFDGMVGELMCFDQVFQHAMIGKDIFFLRGPGTFQIAVRGGDFGLIEGDPEFHFAAQRFHDGLGIAVEVHREIRMGDTALFREPDGERPVPERDEWFHVSLAEGEDDASVVFDRSRIENSLFGFYARPFDAETVRVVSEGLCEIEIFLKARIVVACSAGKIIFWFFGFASGEFPGRQMTEMSSRFPGEPGGALLLPFGPVVVHGAFDLMRGGRCTPVEIFRKCE